MDEDTKSRIFKILCIIFVVLLVIGFGLKKYNDNRLKETIDLAVETVGIAFNASTEYKEGTSRVIVTKYVKDEKELFEVTKKALQILSPIGDYDFIELLSVRAYYDEDKENFQYYDIYFSDIKRLEWDKMNTFNDFLNQL